MRFYGYRDRQSDITDQQGADYISRQPDFYKHHTDIHLRNAYNFARICDGAEARVRESMAKKEMKRRGIL